VTRRILLVDDEDDIREVAQASLELIAGWDVRTAASGQEAISMAQSDPPDAILLDVMMPEMDGPTTFMRLRELPETREIPIVFLTAKVQAADHRRIGELGAAAVLAKPFDPMRLAEEVSRALGWPV
jgi:CheY-like chemotaxis protein